MQAATVLQVDRSVDPCQYAILLRGAEAERWTEERRLLPAPHGLSSQQP
ncbi:hypothetical protein HaLaN_20271, partial [Haematococcus lacustris]